MPFPRPVEQGAAEFELERQAFRSLLNEFSDVPDLLRSEQMAAAFVVEDAKREAPAAWGQTVEGIRGELRAAREQEGIPGITWRFAREVYDRYDRFLTECLQAEQSLVRQENLQLLQAGIRGAFSTRRAAYEAKQRVPMGSVILEHVPQWFAQA